MSMLASSYAKALYDVLQTGEDFSSVLKGFRQVLEVRGHQKLEAAVYKQLIALYEQQEQSDTAVVTVVKESDVEALKADIAETLTSLGAATAEYTVVENEHAVGGYTVRAGHEYVDKSYKKALVELYRNITSHVSV